MLSCGVDHPKTIKLHGLINGGSVVMVNPDATHNFVALKAAERLAISVMESAGFGVALGNGEAVKGKGVCRKVMLELEGGIGVEDDFLPLELGNSDVILGVQWLEKLGVVTTNWKTSDAVSSKWRNNDIERRPFFITFSGVPERYDQSTEERGVLVELNQFEETGDGGEQGNS